jgi:hypothetical protein
MKNAKILTIIFHSLTVITAGHGLGIMLMLDLVSIPSIIKNGYELNLTNEYESRFLISGSISMIGKIILIASLFPKSILTKNILTILGVILLLISFGVLTIGDWFYESLFIISFCSGIPFLMYSGRVIYLMIKEINNIE